MRSWNGEQLLPGVTVSAAQRCLAWSTAMNCLSASGRKLPVVLLFSVTGRAGKLNDAPSFCVERNTYRPLDWSTSPAVALPRLNIWHDRYALPFESQST